MEKAEKLKVLTSAKIGEAFSDEAAAIAKQKFANRLKELNLSPNSVTNIAADPELWRRVTQVAGNTIGKGYTKFADFSAQMVERLGETVKPHLEKLYRDEMTKLGLATQIDEVEIKFTEVLRKKSELIPEKPFPNSTTEYSPVMKDSPYYPERVDVRNSKIYKYNPKHKAEKIGEISAAPKNGQVALDNSIRYKFESSRRIGVDVENNEIVVFDEEFPNDFHGHVRTWNELLPEMKNALIKAGLIDKKGQVIGAK